MLTYEEQFAQIMGSNLEQSTKINKLFKLEMDKDAREHFEEINANVERRRREKEEKEKEKKKNQPEKKK